MSILGSIGHGIKKGVHVVGKVAEKAAPFVGMIPGVGTIAASGIGALGGLAAGDGWKGALKYGAEGALGEIGGNLLGKIPGVGKLMGKVGLNAPTFKGGISALGNTLGIGGGGGTAPAAAQSVPDGMRPDQPGAFANMGGGVPGVGGGPDYLKLIAKYAPLALGAAGAFQNAQNASQGRELTAEQIQQARDAIARQKMLQDRALAPINVAAPDYSNIFGQTQNPFYRPNAAQAGG